MEGVGSVVPAKAVGAAGAGSGGGAGVNAPRRGERPAADVVTSDAFQRAVRDPLVMRVVQAVDGTIKNVRRVAVTSSAEGDANPLEDARESPPPTDESGE